MIRSGRSFLRKNVFYGVQTMLESLQMTYLSIEDYTVTLIDPEVLFDESTIFLGQKTIGKADQTVSGHRSSTEDDDRCS